MTSSPLAIGYKKTPDSDEAARVKELGQETLSSTRLTQSKYTKNKQIGLSHENKELGQERIILWELNKYLEEKIQKELPHEKKELEQERIILWELNRYLTENESVSNKIFDSLSHELRTPIVTIKAYSDMLIKGKFGNLTPEQQEKLERIKVNIDLLIVAIFKMLEKSNERR